MPVSIKKHNKLINEKSPYLQQHAYNPVNWYPWSQEAFKIATHRGNGVGFAAGQKMK